MHSHVDTNRQVNSFVQLPKRYRRTEMGVLPRYRNQMLASSRGEIHRLMRNLPRNYGTSKMYGTASLGDFDLVQRRVLESLSFTKIRDQRDEVRSPFYSTFEWVFEAPGKSELP